MASAACNSLLACHIQGYVTIQNKLDKALTVGYYVNNEGVDNVHAGSFTLNEHRRRGHQHDLCWQVDVYGKHLYLDKLDFTVGGHTVTCKVKVDMKWARNSGAVFECTDGEIGNTKKDIIYITGKCTNKKLHHKCVLSVEDNAQKKW